MASNDTNLVGKKPTSTYRIADHPQAGPALEKASRLISEATSEFRKNPLYMWIDPESKSYVVGNRAQYEDFLASR